MALDRLTQKLLTALRTPVTIRQNFVFISPPEPFPFAKHDIRWAKLEMPVGGRVAGKIGYISGSSGGRSYTGINEEIIWTCIGMSITIALLITMGLCYLAREKCRKRTEYYINA